MATLLAAFAAAPLRAQTGSGFGVEIGGGTIAPVSLGADAAFRLPGRVLFDVGAGWTPPFYVRLINDIVVAAGGYDEATAELIRSSLDNSLALRGAVGWQPFRDLGFELRAGYTLLSLGGGVSPAEAIEVVTGERIDRFGREQIPLYSALHNVHLETGWRWPVGRYVAIRGAVGYIQTVTSNSGFRRDGDLRPDPDWRRIEEAVDDYLRGVFVRYGKAPTLRVSVYFGL